MLKVAVIVGCLSFSVGAFTAGPLSRGGANQNPQRWLEERYKEATSMRAGMSRAELMRVFEEDGGLQRIPAGRYVLRSCRMIKVEVEFDVENGQAYEGVPEEELKIRSVSKPYLEYMHTD